MKMLRVSDDKEPKWSITELAQELGVSVYYLAGLLALDGAPTPALSRPNGAKRKDCRYHKSQFIAWYRGLNS